MIIAELSRYKELPDGFINLAPFVYYFFPSAYTTADYWTDFGAADESVSNSIYISSFARGSSYYTSTSSLLDCIATEKSFYWDNDAQTMYVHLEHDQSQDPDLYRYAQVNGYTDKNPVYIDDIYYDALIESVPSIAQQQDLVNYSKLSFMSGTIDLINTSGVMDFVIDENINGNEVYIYYLDDTEGETDYQRTDLQALAAFYVEDYSISLSAISLDVQDIRKREEIKIPTARFTVTDYPNINEQYEDNVIPVMYGQVRVSEAIPVDGDALAGDANFRQALILTSLGTVQVEIDDLWTTKVPTATDLSTGSFTLAAADGRQANGEPYKCRVVDSIGIANTYASDIIKDLIERYLDLSYTASFYDTTEWEAEETSLESIGILFKDEIELFEAIRIVQSGSNKGFRYEIAADGRRTIRISDYDRTLTNYIQNTEIDPFSISVETLKELLSAYVKVSYAKDYLLDKYLIITDDSEADDVFTAYRSEPTAEIETALVTEAQANARGLLYATRFSDIPKIFSVELLGSEFFFLRIYDMIEIELTNDFVDAATGQITGREFFGIWTAQILSIDPDFEGQKNRITAILTEKTEAVEYGRITEAEEPRLLEDGTYKREVS